LDAVKYFNSSNFKHSA